MPLAPGGRSIPFIQMAAQPRWTSDGQAGSTYDGAYKGNGWYFEDDISSGFHDYPADHTIHGGVTDGDPIEDC